MGIALAIFAALKAASSAVFSILAKVPWWGWLGLAIFFAGWYFGHGGGSLREFACSKAPKPPHTYTVTGTVVSVESANQFTIKDGRRSRGVTMAFLAVKDEAGGLAITGKLLTVGSSVSVKVEGRRILGDEAEAEPEPPEARGNLMGIVTGPTGADVGLELIRDGRAQYNPGAPKSYQAAELSAKKQGRGIWAK